MDADFEWDERKNKQNLRKHGVSFEEAQYVFKDILRIIHEDREHSATEKRYFCTGQLGTGIVTVRFTYRNKKIRIIGAGYWRKGRWLYEQKYTIYR